MKYLFIRLYDVKYIRQYHMTILKQCIKLLGNRKKDSYAHASINFNLKDFFYGLTFYPSEKYDVKIESVNYPQDNHWMSIVNLRKSYFKIVAIPVLDEEYNKAINILKNSLDDRKFKYDLFTMMKIPLAIIDEYRTRSKEFSLVDSASRLNLVCSTFVFWVIDTVSKLYHEWISIKHPKYGSSRLLPDDVLELPDTIQSPKLNLYDYDKEVRNWILTERPEFSEYIN